MYPSSPKNAIRLSTTRADQVANAALFGAHRRPTNERIGRLDVSLIPNTQTGSRRAEFSLEVRLPEVNPTDGMRMVRYCDVCRRWGPRGTLHLCGRNWHEHLGELLASIGEGGAR